MTRKERKEATERRVNELRKALVKIANYNGVSVAFVAEDCAKHKGFAHEAHLLRRAARMV